MGWPPRPVLARLLAEAGLDAPVGEGDAPVEQRIGRCQERSLGAERRGRGAYYTPPAIVDFLIEHTLAAWIADRSDEERAELSLLDPACGAGAFLAAAYRHLLRRYKDRGGGTALGYEARRAVLLRHIHGVELAPKTAILCRLALGLVLLEQDAPSSLSLADLVDLTNNIRCGNALIPPAAPGTQDPPEPPFDWHGAFPAVFSRPSSGFDVVLGNPPYLGGVQRLRTRLPGPLLSYLRAHYAAARGTIDVSVLFQELALRLLATGGRCGLLVPNKFLAAPFGAAFRTLCLSRAELRVLADLSETRLFPGAAVYPVVYVLEARPPRRGHPVQVHRFAPSSDGLRVASQRTVPVDIPEGAPWTPLLSDAPDLVRRLQMAAPPLAAHYEIRAAATAEEAYRLRDEIQDGKPGEPAFLFLTSGAIDRYGHRHGQAPQRYLGRRLVAPYLPIATASLSATRRRQYSGEKIVIASMTRRI